ncbi:MAG: glycoside hydrolase family 30 beta sandwich domain-containing protein, partial [Planctomycetota bacterium]
AWVRTSTAAGSTVKMTFKQTDDSGTTFSNGTSGTADNTGWTELSGNFTLTVDGTLTELFVYFEGPDAGIDIYVDDAVVYGPKVALQANGTVNATTAHQMIEGFGAAGAWYDPQLVTLGQSQPAVYDVLFGDLGLDIYRLRNKYAQDGDTDYMSNSSTIITNAEASLGRPLKILMSAWSPPAYLKSNGETGNGGTLIGGPNNYDYTGLATWWADSITAWSSQPYGVDADYISIQNEPDWTATWDTCLYDPTENSTNAGYDQAFEAVFDEMDTRFGASMPKMLAPENIGFQAGWVGNYRLDDYLNAIINHSHVYAYAHHLYGGGNGQDPDSYIPEMQDVNASWGSKPLFQTEYQDSIGAWPDAFNIALLLHNSLTVEEVSAYLYWDLFWGVEGRGMVSITASSYTINNVYYGFKQYSAFVHSDWQRIDATEDSADVRMSAYVSPDNSQMSVVIINTSSTTDADLSLSFNGFTVSSGDVYRTSQTEDCAYIGGFDPNNPLTLPSESVTTLSLVDMTPPAAPTGLTATAGNAMVSLNWNDNSEPDLAGYNVWRSTTSGSGHTRINGALVTSSDYTDNTVTIGTPYYYVVTAVDSLSNESGNSNEDSATPYDGNPPLPPTGLTATANYETVSLQWNDNSEGDLAGYNIYRSTTSGTGYTKLNGPLLVTSDYTDNAVANYTSYFYVVTAVDIDANESGNSNQDSATPNHGIVTQLNMEDFELGLGAWTNIPGEDTHDWTRNSGGTPTNNSGPDGGAGGSTWYVYLETSNPGANNEGDTAILESPDIGGILGRVLTFDYHMFGNEMGTLYVDVFDGTWHPGIWSLSGSQQTSSSDPYQTARVDLAEYTGPIRIRLRGVAVGGIRGDMAIDNIEVTGISVYGDFDFDNLVDANDLAEFMSHWLETDCVNLDLNGDCLINLDEFAEVAKNWLYQF